MDQFTSLHTVKFQPQNNMILHLIEVVDCSISFLTLKYRELAIMQGSQTTINNQFLIDTSWGYKGSPLDERSILESK